MRRVLFGIALLLLALAAPLSPPAAAQATQTATVTASALNVRGGPGVGYGIVGVVRYGETLPVLGQQSGWVNVSYRGRSAWVSGRYVRLIAAGTPSTAPAPPAAQPAPSAMSGSDGGKIVFATSPGGTIYTLNADGSNLRRVGVGLDPSWSPSGDQIAYADWRTPRGLYVMNADGSGARQVYSWDLLKAPSWSPDGSRIAFSFQKGGRQETTERCFFGYCFTLERDPWWRLGIVDLATGDLRQPLSDSHSFSPVWRSSSELLYDGTPGLEVASAYEDEQPRLLAGDARLFDPRLCEASGKIAATFHQHDHWEVYTLNGDGSGLARLTGSESVLADPTGNNVAPAWSPDCSQILFLTDRDGRWRPYVMNADGSNERPFLPGTFDALRFDYGFSSDRVFDWTE